MDKAKKMAEQAQAKLDEVQRQFNERAGRPAATAARPVEYDKHGRPVQPRAGDARRAAGPRAARGRPPASRPPSPRSRQAGRRTAGPVRAEDAGDAAGEETRAASSPSGDPLAG